MKSVTILLFLILSVYPTLAQQRFSSGKIKHASGYTISYDVQMEKPRLKSEYCAEIPYTVTNLVVYSVERGGTTYSGNNLAISHPDFPNGITFPINVSNSDAFAVRPNIDFTFEGSNYTLSSGNDPKVIVTCPNDIDASVFINNPPKYQLSKPGFLPCNIPAKNLTLCDAVSRLTAYKAQQSQSGNNSVENDSNDRENEANSSPTIQSDENGNNSSSETQSTESNETDEYSYENTTRKIENETRRVEETSAAVGNAGVAAYDYVKSGADSGLFTGIRISVNTRSLEEEKEDIIFSQALSTTTYEVGIGIGKGGFSVGLGPGENGYSGLALTVGIFYDIFDLKIDDTSFFNLGLSGEYGTTAMEIGTLGNNDYKEDTADYYGAAITARLFKFLYFSAGYGFVDGSEIRADSPTEDFSANYLKIAGGLHFNF